MTPTTWPRYDVLGVRVDSLGVQEAAEVVATMAERRLAGYVCVTGTHGIIESQSNSDLAGVHNASSLTVPDGKPVAAIGRMLGLGTEQVRGIELTRAVLAAAQARDLPVAFAGSTPEVLADLQDALRREFPTLRVALLRALPFGGLDADYVAALRRDVSESGAGVCFLGLSTPKQEAMAALMKDAEWPFVTLAVGAAFDFLAGTKDEAPTWTRRIYLEWAYRMVTEPRRLFARYRRVVPQFLARLTARHPQRLPDVVMLWPAEHSQPASRATAGEDRVIRLPDVADSPGASVSLS